MVLDVLGAAVLIAIGVVAIYFSIESGLNDRQLMIVIVLGLLAIAGGSWLLIAKLTLGLLLKKLAGLILAGLGLFLAVGFPDIADYQAPAIGRSGVFIGLVLLIFGAYLLFF